jgi:hypothetical protein
MKNIMRGAFVILGAVAMYRTQDIPTAIGIVLLLVMLFLL